MEFGTGGDADSSFSPPLKIPLDGQQVCVSLNQGAFLIGLRLTSKHGKGLAVHLGSGTQLFPFKNR